MIWWRRFSKRELETFYKIKKFRLHTDEEVIEKAKSKPLKLISTKKQKVLVSQKKYSNPLNIKVCQRKL